MQEYAELGPTPETRFERLQSGRNLARGLKRHDPSILVPKLDPLVVRNVVRQRRRPHIFSVDEIRELFAAADRNGITRTTTYGYLSIRGLLSRETVEPGRKAVESITTYGRDAFGNVTSAKLAIDGPNNDRTVTIQYDSAGRFPTKAINPLKQETLRHRQAVWREASGDGSQRYQNRLAI